MSEYSRKRVPVAAPEPSVSPAPAVNRAPVPLPVELATPQPELGYLDHLGAFDDAGFEDAGFDWTEMEVNKANSTGVDALMDYKPAIGRDDKSGRSFGKDGFEAKKVKHGRRGGAAEGSVKVSDAIRFEARGSELTKNGTAKASGRLGGEIKDGKVALRAGAHGKKGGADWTVNDEGGSLRAHRGNFTGAVNIHGAEKGGDIGGKTKIKGADVGVNIGVTHISDTHAGQMDSSVSKVARAAEYESGNKTARKTHGVAWRTGFETNVSANLGVKAVEVEGQYNHRDETTSAYYTTNESVDAGRLAAVGASPDIGSLSELQAKNPDAYQKYLETFVARGSKDQRIRSLSDIDPYALKEGEGVSLTSNVSTSGGGGVTVSGFGVSANGGEAQYQQQTLHRGRDGKITVDLKVGESSSLGGEVSAGGGLLSVGVDSAESQTDEVRFTFDTKTEEGRQALDAYLTTGILPGAIGEDHAFSETYQKMQADLAAGKPVDMTQLRAIAHAANSKLLAGGKKNAPVMNGVEYTRVSNARTRSLDGKLGIAGIGVANMGTQDLDRDTYYRYQQQDRLEVTRKKRTSHLFGGARSSVQIDPEQENHVAASEKTRVSVDIMADINESTERHVSNSVFGEERVADQGWLDKEAKDVHAFQLELKQKHLDAVMSGEAGQGAFENIAKSHSRAADQEYVEEAEAALAAPIDPMELQEWTMDIVRERKGWFPTANDIEEAKRQIRSSQLQDVQQRKEHVRFSQIDTAAEFAELTPEERLRYMSRGRSSARVMAALMDPDTVQGSEYIKHVLRGRMKGGAAMMKVFSDMVKYGAEGAKSPEIAKMFRDSAKFRFTDDNEA